MRVCQRLAPQSGANAASRGSSEIACIIHVHPRNKDKHSSSVAENIWLFVLGRRVNFENCFAT